MAHEPKRHPAREHHHLGGPAGISDASLAARSLRGKPVVRRRDHAGGPTGGPAPGRAAMRFRRSVFGALQPFPGLDC